jgi:cell division septum initiation protein DivIVA
VVSPLLVQAQNEAIQIEPDRKYYQVGDVIVVHIRWNGTSYRYAISLGPYLKLKEWRLTGFQETTRREGTVTQNDPDQWWTIEIYNTSTAVQTPTYYDIGIFNTTTGEMVKKIHRDIIIIGLTPLIEDYNTVKMNATRLKQENDMLKQEIARNAEEMENLQKAVTQQKRATEVARKFSRYFDYVKFVNKSLQELGLITLANIKMSIVVPEYYDPELDQWVTLSADNIAIFNGKLYYKVPWYLVRNATGNTTEAYISLEALEDPNNLENILLWNEWFNGKEMKAKQSYKTLYSYSWIVPLSIAGIIVLAIIAGRLWFRRTWKRWFRQAEERGIAPPA